MAKRNLKTDVVVFQSKSGAIEFKGDFEKQNLWASQSQLVELFEVDQSVVSRHIRNIFKDGEISQKSNMQKMHIANSDKPVTYYSLDVILAVGYRANSKVAISFRKWATNTLKSHIIDGFTINRKRLTRNYDAFLSAIDDVKKLANGSSGVGVDQTLELVKVFADTWFSLNAYDKSSLPNVGANKKLVKITAEELSQAVTELKNDLIIKKEASDLFAQERQKGSLNGIVASIFQSAFGIDAYQTVEEKAAHLLYFIVKNHPFSDGNKRSGAFAFVWFLKKAQILNTSRLSPEALTTLTLLVAESNPKEKERMIGLILIVIKQ